jgi:RNA polymerase sigma-70 factor (ECF subfamily)
MDLGQTLDTIAEIMPPAIDSASVPEARSADARAAVGDMRQAGAPSDQVLATAVATGDLDALGKIYDTHHGAVRAFARRLIDHAAAEDLVHDTFLTLPKAFARWNGEGSLRTFIMGVAVNHARHRVRSKSRFSLAMLRFSREPERNEQNPEETSEQKRLAEMLRRALETLSFDHRTTFVLCEVEERTSVEVAEILGIPEGTVRTRLHHAKQKLRAVLIKEGAR